jgi:hypothetical protein
MSHYLRLAYKTESSEYLKYKYSFNKWIYYYNLDNSFYITHDRTLAAQVHFYYLSPVIQGIFNNGKMYNLSLGIQKKIKHFTISLSANDLLYSNYYKMDVHYLDQRNGFVYKNDTRSFGVSIRYSFNRKDGKNKDIEGVKTPEELNRINLYK